MLKQIKMSYADKDIRLTVDENDKLVKAEIRKAGDPSKFEEVKSSWVGKTPSWNKLDEVLSEIAGVKVQKRRLFECFDSVKAELHDAPVEVKESFNDVVSYFDSDYWVVYNYPPGGGKSSNGGYGLRGVTASSKQEAEQNFKKKYESQGSHYKLISVRAFENYEEASKYYESKQSSISSTLPAKGKR